MNNAVEMDVNQFIVDSIHDQQFRVGMLQRYFRCPWILVNSTMEMDKYTVEIVIVSVYAPQLTDGEKRADQYSVEISVYHREGCFYYRDSSKCHRDGLSISVCL